VYQPHASLNTPGDDVKLWRYMDLSRFLHLLSEREVYFSKLREFEDKWEGVVPNSLLEAIKSDPLYLEMIKHLSAGKAF